MKKNPTAGFFLFIVASNWVLEYKNGLIEKQKEAASKKADKPETVYRSHIDPEKR
ncbi:MAG TPA: hypothetical protein VMU30_05455 [Bacteroidota bacterium]|nr:hypothetical protein [Bacteroidota bacterium]